MSLASEVEGALEMEKKRRHLETEIAALLPRKEFGIPAKPSTTSEAEEEEDTFESPATPEPHEEDVQEELNVPEEEEATGTVEKQWNDLDTESPEEEVFI